MKELEGVCPRCGLGYYGWALDNELNRFCVKCGSPLEIRRDGVHIVSGSSAFKVEKYKVSSEQDDWKDSAG
jgi:hypothetical protein